MRNHSVTFVVNDDDIESHGCKLKQKSLRGHLRYYFTAPVEQLPTRLLEALIPPVPTPRIKNIYVDFNGPFLILIILIHVLLYGLLNNGYYKYVWVAFLMAVRIPVLYLTIFPFFVFILCKLCGTIVTYLQVLSLCGYALFGHLLTLLLSEVFKQETSYSVFFFLFTVLGGLGTARFVLILSTRTPAPALRFLLCSPIAVLHMLFLVYMQFACMRKKNDNSI